MKDIKINFKGDSSVIDLNSFVTGKEVSQQKYLVNIVTEQGSDPLYDYRGTTLLQDAINGLAYNTVSATHVANFAALDTNYFFDSIKYYNANEDNSYTISSGDTDPDGINTLTILPITIDIHNSTLDLSVKFIFNDKTETRTVSSVPTRL